MSTAERVVTLTAAISKLEIDLAAAVTKVESLQGDYDRDVLGRLANGDAKGSRAARQAISDAQHSGEDLKIALGQAREHLRAAQDEQRAEAEAAQWNAAEALADGYVAGMAKHQSDVDAMIASFLAIQELANAMLRSAPKRGRVGESLAEHQRVHDTMMYIAARGGPRLGRLGAKTLLGDQDWLQRQPDLTAKAQAIKAELLSQRNAPGDRAA